MLVNAALYRHGQRDPQVTDLAAINDACRHDGAFAWIGLYEPDEAEFAHIQNLFSLHELAVHDALQLHHRPTLETYGDSHLLVLKTATYVDPEEAVTIGEIRVFFGRDFVVAVRYGEASPLVGTRAWLERRPDLLALGPGAVIYKMCDTIVADYQPVVDGLDVDISQVEEEVFADARVRPTERIYKLKREVLDFHHACAPLAGPVERMAAGAVEFFPDPLDEYFGDVDGNLARIVERVDVYRDLLNSVLEANLTQVGIRQNDDMRRISAWVAIAVVPTAVAGIYGMNFRQMPFLDHPLGFPVVLVLTGLVCVFLWSRFRKSGWV